MDYIEIQGIACEARLGVLPKERKEPQFVRVDLRIGLELDAAANTDDLELTVDYHKLVKGIQKTVRDHECQLLESLASHLCSSVMTEPRIREATLRVYKFPSDLAQAIENVAVEITRSHES